MMIFFTLDDFVKRAPNRFFWDPGLTCFEGLDRWCEIREWKHERDASGLQVWVKIWDNGIDEPSGKAKTSPFDGKKFSFY